MASPQITIAPADIAEHAEWLRRLAASLLRDDDAAGDLAQEAWEVALRQGPREPGPLRPWLTGVIKNLVRMRARSNVRRVRREHASADAAQLGASAPTPAQLVERVQAQQHLSRFVLALDEQLRTVVLLRYYEGLSSAQIAERLGIAAGTVRWRLKRGLDELRTAMDEDAGGDRKRWAAVLAPLATAPAGEGSTAAAVGGVILMKTMWKLAAIAAILLLAWLGGQKLGWWGGSDAAVTTGDAPPTPNEPAASAVTTVSSGQPPRSMAARQDDPAGDLRLEGQVIDDHDRPLGGARVAISTWPPRTLVAEADGSFAFDGLIGREYQLEAHHETLYAGPVRLRLGPDSEPVILRALPAATVVIEVVAEDGASARPVAGAEVELRSSLTWRTTTDETGVATLRGVGGYDHPLHVRADGYAPTARYLSVPERGQQGRERIVLVRGAPVGGVVRDAGGQPVAGARVIADLVTEPFPVVDPRRDGILSDARGRWRMPAVGPGTVRFTATHPGHAPGSTAPIALDGSSERTGIDIALTPGAAITGRVIDSEGNPVAGADVRILARGSLAWRSTRLAVSDGDGRFTTGGLPRRAMDVHASSADGASQIAQVDLRAEPQSEVELVLAAGATLAGVVVDERGAEIAEAQVVVEPEWSGALGEREAWAVRGVESRIADSGGRFRFAGLPTGPYRVRASWPGDPEATAWLSPGQVVSAPDAAVRLVVPSPGQVQGRVLFADGSAPEAFRVAIGPLPATAFDSPNGGFLLSAPGGTHNVTITGPGFRRALVTAEIEGAGVTDLGTITVERGRTISGRVLDLTGAPVAGAQVAAGPLLTGDGATLFIADESPGARATETDGEGRFVFDGFGPRQLTIAAGKPDAGRSASVQLPPGEDSVTIDLILQPTGAMEGTVIRDGQPSAETVMIANPVGATSSNYFVVTGPDGSFALDMLPPGEWVVYPMFGGGGSRPKDMFVKPVTVVVGERARVDFDVRSGTASLAVSVSTDAGAPVPVAQLFYMGLQIDAPSMAALRDGAWIAHHAGDGAVPFAIRMALGGQARFDGLSPGASTVCATPLTFNPNDPVAAEAMRERIEALPMKCERLTVEGAPTGAPQQLSIVVPAAWLTP